MSSQRCGRISLGLAIGQNACPIFYQYVSNEVMKLVIKAEFQVDSTISHGLESS